MKHINYKQKCRYCKKYFVVEHGGKQMCPKCHAIHYNIEIESKPQKRKVGDFSKMYQNKP